LIKPNNRLVKSSRHRFIRFRRNRRPKDGRLVVDWRLIFELSPVNGGVYTGDDLVPRPFRPKTNSWFQKRLAYVRAELKKEILEEPGRFANDS